MCKHGNQEHFLDMLPSSTLPIEQTKRERQGILVSPHPPRKGEPMHALPPAIIYVLRQFERLFSERVWEWAKILLIGAIMAPGKRTVTAALRSWD